MSIAEHIHADPGAIEAALYRPRPPAVPLGVWLDFLADAPATPPSSFSFGHPDDQLAAPPEVTMSKNCSKCGKELRSDNTKGFCGQVAQCKARQGAGGEAVAPSKPKTPPKLKREKKPDVGWLVRFRQLHEALGLDAEAALEQHCRQWVEATTSRALAQSAKPVRLHSPRAEQQPSTETGG